MKTLDIAVIGSGIGGGLIAALNSKKNIYLFEKEKNLGGCASTFQRDGNYYNTGATTVVGYEENHILKKQFDAIGVVPNISKSPIAMRVIQGKNSIDRVKDFDLFLENINTLYPNKNNLIFWKKLQQIDEKFWKLKNIYYGKYCFKHYTKTALFVVELIKVFQLDIFKSANYFIKEHLGDISQEYKNFIDSQLLITVQTTSENISLLSLALGLCYPFHDVFYPYGGMGNLIEDILKEVPIKKNEAITNITQDGKEWIVQSSKNQYRTKQLILNSSLYQSAHLFENQQIKKYYDSFSFSDQSAFVVYLTLDSKEDFLEHYQFILEKILPNSISHSFFVSFSRKDDKKLSSNGYSITISTHTKALYWKNLSKKCYSIEKQRLQDIIIEKFLNYFNTIKKENIKNCFSATSVSFNRYIGRYNCGGKAMGWNNITQLPSCNTPFEGLYNVGDTIFAGQGWPGIAIGVDVLQRQLNG